MTSVVTNGCFDPLTGSHVGFLDAAAAEGDTLIVLLATDEVVRRSKGSRRPLLPYDHRRAVLLGLRSVDYVMSYGSETELADVYRHLKPAVLVKGTEWEGSKLTGQEHCKRVVFLPERPGHASDFLSTFLTARDPGPHVQVVKRSWGEEWVWADAPDYTAKLMRVFPGWQSSLHRHPVKDETFYGLTGEVLIRHGASAGVLRPGDTVRILPGHWHRFGNRGPHIAEFLEAGTKHSDGDVERVEEGGELNEGDWSL